MSNPYDPNQPPQNPYQNQPYPASQQPPQAPPPQPYGQPPYPPQQGYGPAPQNYAQQPMYTPKNAGIGIPELLQATIAFSTQPSTPPFGLVRGRGNLVMSIAYVFIGSLVAGALNWLLYSALYKYTSGLAFSSLLSSAIGFTAGFVAFVFVVAQLLKLGTNQRDEFASAASIYWVPVTLVLAVLGTLLGGINFINLLSVVTSTAQTLLLLGFSLMALKLLIGQQFEQTLKAVGIGLLTNIFVISLVARILIELF